MRFSICDCPRIVVARIALSMVALPVIAISVIAISMAGCASHKASPATRPVDAAQAAGDEQTLPILYHRMGGIAGTDDRVVIWPGGLVQVTGRIIPSATAHIDKSRVQRLNKMFAGWDKLNDRYLATGTADAYLIRIYFGNKAVEASDLATDLPPQFRQIYTEIESIASQAANSDEKPAP